MSTENIFLIALALGVILFMFLSSNADALTITQPAPVNTTQHISKGIPINCKYSKQKAKISNVITNSQNGLSTFDIETNDSTAKCKVDS